MAHNGGDSPDRAEGDRARADQRQDAFARVFARNDRWLYAYLVTLLGSPDDAEEVFQDVCVVLWREHEKFDPSTDFKKWGSVIAHNQVRRFRRERRRVGPQLSDELVDLLAEEVRMRSDLLESRRGALRNCLQKLAPGDRELVGMCYAESSTSFKGVATSLGKPVNTVYKALNRIRKSLHRCIDRTMSTEGSL